MALNLTTVKKKYEKNADFYNLDDRDEKKTSTATPWEDFEAEEDLVDRIKSRDAVTRRIVRKEFKKSEKAKKQKTDNELSKAITKTNRPPTYTDQMLTKKISERAKEIFNAINP